MFILFLTRHSNFVAGVSGTEYLNCCLGICYKFYMARRLRLAHSSQFEPGADKEFKSGASKLF